MTARITLPTAPCPEAVPIRRIARLVSDRRARTRLEGYARTLDRAPAHRRGVLLTAIAVVECALAHVGSKYVRAVDLPPHTPYPKVDELIAARLILGERPVDLAPGLTRREAHEWLRDGAPSVCQWYVQRHALRLPNGLRLLGSDVVDLRVAMWLVARWHCAEQRAALERPRREVVAGQAIEGRYLDRVDELRPSDLVDSVDGTFRRAAERLTRQLERALESRGEPLRAAPRWWRPVRCARLLLSGSDLVREGRALRHCVGTYAEAVRSGHSVIVGLCVLGQRSTVELDPRTLEVRQHRGLGNGAPPELCVLALAVCRRRWLEAAGLIEGGES